MACIQFRTLLFILMRFIAHVLSQELNEPTCLRFQKWTRTFTKRSTDFYVYVYSKFERQRPYFLVIWTEQLVC